MTLTRKTLLAALLAGACAGAASAGDDVRTLDHRFREVAARAIPATVLVKSTLADGSGRTGFGSGAIISADGYVLTCCHVVDIAGEVEVVLSSADELPAKVVGKNPKQDYALLKVERQGLPHFKLGDSSKVALGDWVIALGHPGGPYPDFKPAFSVGRVTGLHRRLPVQMMDRFYDDAVRTDAPIFAGNSGGPLVTLDGELVGLNGAILLVNENSYAVPVNEIAAHLDELKKGGEVAGRSPSDQSGSMPFDEFQGKDLAKLLGRAGRRLFGRDGLGKLVPGSGAEHDRLASALDNLGRSLEGERAQAMLRDLFDAFGGRGGEGRGDGARPPDLKGLRKKLEDLFAGDGGEKPRMPDLSELRKELGDLFSGGDQGEGPLKDLLDRLRGGGEPDEPSAPAADAPDAYLGVTPLTGEAARGLAGIRVDGVTPRGPAELAGMAKGDLLVSIDGARLRDTSDLAWILRRRKPGDAVRVHVLRVRLLDGLPVEGPVDLVAKLGRRPGALPGETGGEGK